MEVAELESLDTKKEIRYNECKEELSMPKVKVNEIKAAIEALPEEEYVRLRRWFSERDWEKWDRQIELDSESGKLDFLIREALDEKVKGNLKGL